MHIRCTLVIYLYLLDADGVNTIVLATYTFSTGIELWKVLKVLRLRWRLSQYESELRAEAKTVASARVLLAVPSRPVCCALRRSR